MTDVMPISAVQRLGRSAVISEDGTYRYQLYRMIGGLGGTVATFIMLNPSTADAVVDDPTIRKCLGFSLRWGCAELQVVNLFAFRATDPADLRRSGDPVGPKNRDWIRRSVEEACKQIIPGPVVCAWGRHGTYMGRDEIVMGWIEDLCAPMCLGLTRDGHPRHPLYVSYAARLVPFGRTANSSNRTVAVKSRGPAARETSSPRGTQGQ
jgi:hypothetical protein